MSRVALDTFVALMEDAFEGDADQSLIANLRDVGDADWLAVPPGGGRSIGDICEHVGWAKWMYDDYAFGGGAMAGDQPPLVTDDGTPRPRGELLAWLRDGHRRLMASVGSLVDDAELDVLRLTNWGERLPTRTLLRIMIAHDWYHAGEINHLRALLQGTDEWPY